MAELRLFKEAKKYATTHLSMAKKHLWKDEWICALLHLGQLYLGWSEQDLGNKEEHLETAMGHFEEANQQASQGSPLGGHMHVLCMDVSFLWEWN